MTPRDAGGESFDRKNLRRQLTSIADRMMRGHIWLQGADKAMRCTKRPLTGSDIAKHVDSDEPFGLCPIRPGESTTRIALLDMDSHKGEVSWREMCALANVICTSATPMGLRAIPFRSTGGSGIHLLFVFATPQDAYSVRELLAQLLARAGLKSGTKGVAKGEVEVFPKQDAVPEDGFGSMFILPYSRKSCALHPEDFSPIAIAHIEISDPVPVLEKPAKPERDVAHETPEAARVWSAMRALPEQDYDYEHWRNIVFAIHDATEGSNEGLAIAQEYNDTRHPHERGPGWLASDVWPHIGPGEITAGTLFHHAREAGWRDIEGATDGFDDVPDAPAGVGAAGAAQADGGGENASSKGAAAPPVAALTFADVRGLSLYPPEPRQWIVRDWLARGVVTGLFSRGGLGKTLLVQQLATCITLGQQWLGMDVVPGRVLGIFCEEDDNDLRWRQRMIMSQLDPMDEIELDNERLMLSARLGGDNTLMRFDSERRAKRTGLFKLIEQTIAERRPDLVILDNIAQLFAGIENDRAQVTIFVNSIARLARDYGCAVLLLGHTAKAEGSSFSGSTAWENVTRVRWRLERDKEEDATSTLSVEKSNLGSRPKLTIAYKGGAFIAAETGQLGDVATALMQHVVLAIQERPEEAFGAHPNHKRFLPRALTSIEGAAGGFTLEQLTRGMKSALAAGLIDEAEAGQSRGGHVYKRLVVTDLGNQWLSDNVLKGKDSDDLA